uniref:Uncharacterized protein n=1 Tax=Onchocerca volvulus TaxID=6282 RepID=A0A8R1U3X5_ONCVO
MTLTIIISLICVVLNISYTIAASIVCIRKRNVETKKVESKQLKLPNPKQPPGPAALPAGANIQGAVAAASVPKQLLQKSPTATNQTQKKINDEHVQPTQPSSKRGESAKDGQENLLQRIKDRREKKNEVRYEQYVSLLLFFNQIDMYGDSSDCKP